MATHFHSLKVKEVKRETPDCVSVSFVVPADLTEIFSFKEGQNITIKKNIRGEEVRRSYSVCNAPFEKELRVAIKKTTGGLFSSFANDELKAGDSLEIMPPIGRFNAKTETGNYLAIAAGSGITPIISIIKHTLKTNLQSNFTLIYGNKSRGSIIFFEEIEALKNKFMERFTCVNILSREKTDAEINYGRIGTKKLEGLQHLMNFKTFNDAFICGPEEMIFASAAFLEGIGMAKKNIHFELFTTPGQKKLAVGNEQLEEEKDNGPKSNITIKLDGRSFNFDLPTRLKTF